MMAVFFVKTSLILLVAIIATALMRRSSAASRHVVWTTALLAVLCLPIASAVMPALRLPWLPLSLDEVAAAQAVRLPEREVFEAMPPPLHRDPSPSARSGRKAAPAAPARSGGSWPWLGVAWLAGSAALLTRIGRGYRARRRLIHRTVRTEDARLTECVSALSRGLGIRRPVRVLIAPAEVMPATWGLVRPCLLLPPSALTWTDEHLTFVVTHELAHVLRFDTVAHGVAQFARALAWWNPLVWVAAASAQFERERACDDLVLRAGLVPSAYADALLTMARTLPSPVRDHVALAMARPHRIERRLSAILDPHRPRTGTSHLCASLTSIVLAAQLPLAALRLDPVPLDPATPPEQVALRANPSDSMADYAAAVGHVSRPANTPAAAPRVAPLILPDITGTWEPVPPQDETLVALFEVGIAPIRGPFAVSQTADTLTVTQTLPGDFAERVLAIMGRDITRLTYTTAEWNAIYRLDGDELVAHFRPQTPIRFRRVQDGARAPRATAPQPIPAGEFGAGAYRPGNGVTNPIRIREVKPTYTPQAERAGLQGTVELEAVISAAGTVSDVRVTRSLDATLGLDSNAMDAVRNTTFVPCKLRDQAVPCIVVFELQYALPPPSLIPAGQFGAGAYLYRSGAGMEAPVVIRDVRPQYTPDAMRARIQGGVTLEVVVNADGTAGEVRVDRSLDRVFGLDEQAIKAVRAMRWRPGTFKGNAVAMVMLCDLTFTLR